jgi:hypothetical protein
LTRRRKKARRVTKKAKRFKEVISGQFINTCKLGANSNGKNIKNHKPSLKK